MIADCGSDRLEPRDQVLGGALQRQIRRQRHEEEEEGKEGEDEIVSQLRGAVGDGVVRPALVERLREPENAQLAQPGDEHGRKVATTRRGQHPTRPDG